MLVVRDTRAMLTQQLGRPPGDEEIAEAAGLSLAELREAERAEMAFRPYYLDAPVSAEDEAATFGELLGEDDPGIERALDSDALWAHWSGLPERQQHILAMRFYGNMTQAEIGERLGISQMHVSRLLDVALTSLRECPHRRAPPAARRGAPAGKTPPGGPQARRPPGHSWPGLDGGRPGSGPAHRLARSAPGPAARRWRFMPRGSSPKRERQYEHIKESAKERGESTGRAEEIAARTVNKERARSGEAKTASRSSTQDISSARRGGQRSHRGAGGPTKAQLYAEARRRGHEGPLVDDQGAIGPRGRPLTHPGPARAAPVIARSG